MHVCREENRISSVILNIPTISYLSTDVPICKPFCLPPQLMDDNNGEICVCVVKSIHALSNIRVMYKRTNCSR